MKGKGRRGNRNSGKANQNRRDVRERRDERESEGYRDPARNDISWYSRNPNLLIAAGSFPYPNRPGMKVSLGTESIPNGDSTITFNRIYNIPGVLSLDWVPHVGYSAAATDPPSILGKEMYAKVRQKYSGSLDADAPDFVMYVMALDSIFAYIAWLKRLYRVLTAWSPNNFILPDTVVEAMRIPSAGIQSLREHRTQLWQCINELVLQSRKFTCPASMDIFNRHYWMSDNVYTDETTINSQFYMFNLIGVYQFAMLDMPDGNPGPGLKMVNLPHLTAPSNVNVEAFYNFGLSLINALVAWDEAYTINGYLMRAYEGDQLFIVDELPADQPFTPVYEPEVLMQIENSRTVMNTNGYQDISGLNVTQDVATNAVISKPKITYFTQYDEAGEYATFGYNIPPWLSVRSDAPTVADSVVASRLQALVVNPTPGANNTVVMDVVAATEIPFTWRYYDATNSAGNGMIMYQTPGFLVAQTSGTITNGNQVYTACVRNIQTARIEQFDWHPFIFYSMIRTGTVPETYFSVGGDTHNITFIRPDDLRNLHRVCIYSELNSFSLS